MFLHRELRLGASFAAKSSENTRELRSSHASMVNARLSPDFHQNHAQSPLAVLVDDPWFAEVGALIRLFLRFSLEQYSAGSIEIRDRRILLFLRGKSVFSLTRKSDSTKTLERDKNQRA